MRLQALNRRKVLAAGLSLAAAPGANAVAGVAAEPCGDRRTPSGIVFVECGCGHPILFLHGWNLDHHIEQSDYEPLFAAESDWRRLYVDLPGMGASSSLEIRHQDEMLEALLTFVDEALPGQSFLLAGTSAGAYLARGILARRPDRVDGLLLRVPLMQPDRSRRELPQRLTILPSEETASTIASGELVHSSRYAAVARDRRARLILPAVARASEAIKAMPDSPERYSFSFDVDRMDRPYLKPTLIMTGRQDTVVGYSAAYRLLQSFPRATFAVLDRADHAWPVDDKSLFAALVSEWLRRVREVTALTW